MLKNQKGTALLIVLAIILVIVLLSTVIVSFTLSHSRLSKHQIDRTKARYAAQAGINYAFEMLRVGCWTTGQNYSICNVSGCVEPNLTDTDLPFKIDIVIGSPNVDGIAEINSTVNYTYQP